MRITARQAQANLQLTSQEGLIARLTPYIEIGITNEYEIPRGSTITIIETPRNYEGCGRCVKFRVGNNLVNYYTFWSDFKSHTYLEE